MFGAANKRQLSQNLGETIDNKKSKYNASSNMDQSSPTTPTTTSSNADIQMNYDEISDDNQMANQTATSSYSFNSNIDRKYVGLDTFNDANVYLDCIENDHLLLTLDENEVFCFKGKLSICVLYGCAQINGYLIDSKEQTTGYYDLYSPDTNAHLCVIPVSNDNNQDNRVEIDKNVLFDKICDHFTQLMQHDNDEKLNNLRNYLNKIDLNENKRKLIVILKKLQSKLCNYITFFDNYKQLYQTYYAGYCEIDMQFAYFGIYTVESLYSNNNSSVYEPTNDELSIINEIIEQSEHKKSQIILACGGKDVGKSTFLRYLTNCLLNKHKTVAYLDCDPGQCEFTLSSCVQLTLVQQPLFGPPHTHIQHSPYCYALGYLSPNDVPGQYMASVEKCFQHYQQHIQENNCKIPLLVNTMGWNQGLGVCLLKEQINLSKPNYVIQINSADSNKNLPAINENWFENSSGWPSNKPRSFYQPQNYKLLQIAPRRLHTTDSNNRPKYVLKPEIIQERQNQRKFTAKDHRNLATIAYFSELHDTNRYFRPIHNLKPYKVPWQKFAVHCMQQKLSLTDMFRVMNASLVALCNIDEKFFVKTNPKLPALLSDLNANEKMYFKCIGFGIIRGINMESNEFYVLTPEPIERLNKVNTLVKGMLNVPLEFFYEQDAQTASPYVTFTSNDGLNTNIAAATEPMQRKYLVHQPQQQQHQQKSNNKDE